MSRAQDDRRSAAAGAHPDGGDADGWPALQLPLGDVAPSAPPILPAPDAAGGGFAAPAVGATDRLVRLAYRLGVPGAALARPFGRPVRLRLLATVESPLPGDRVAGMALRAGHFLVCGINSPVAAMQYGPAARLTPPLERVVHGFTWLRDLAASAPAPQCAPMAERVLADWLAANPQPAAGAAWQVGHVGRRLLGWLIHAPLILSGPDAAARARTLAAIGETARWLDRAAGRADDRLDEVAAWCAVIAAGLLLPDGKPRRLHGEAGLARALEGLVGADGGVLSRSPLAQMEAIALLIDLAACYRATRRGVPEEQGAMLARLVPPLLGVTHSDGGLGSWQGGPAISGARVAALVAASGIRPRPLADARGWGYQRLSGGASVVQIDAAPPPLARHARTGCAATLAFEMSHGAHRLVVGCGGAACAGGLVPQRLEQGLRATAAHSTLVLGDANSTAVLVGGKLGAGVTEVEVERRRGEPPDAPAVSVVEASHDGYVARYGFLHRRRLALRADGALLEGEDRLVPAGRKGQRARVPFALRFHLGPGVDPMVEAGGGSARLDLPDGSCWGFAAEDGAIELDESLWIDGDGVPQATRQLVVEGMVARGGERLAWRFEKRKTGVE